MYNAIEGTLAPTVGVSFLESLWAQALQAFGCGPRRIEMGQDLYEQLKTWIEEQKKVGLLFASDQPAPRLREPLLYDRLDGTCFVGRYRDIDVLFNPTLPALGYRYFVPDFNPLLLSMEEA